MVNMIPLTLFYIQTYPWSQPVIPANPNYNCSPPPAAEALQYRT